MPHESCFSDSEMWASLSFLLATAGCSDGVLAFVWQWESSCLVQVSPLVLHFGFLVRSTHFNASVAFAQSHSNNLDPYSGGTSNVATDNDLRFLIKARIVRKGLSVSSSGVSFENYSFPSSDGTASQVLRTDGINSNYK